MFSERQHVTAGLSKDLFDKCRISETDGLLSSQRNARLT